MLLEAAWDYDFEPRGNIIDMHVHRLRQKVDHGFPHPLIHTVLGAGYVIREASEPRANPSSTTPTTRSDPASAPRKP
jgi:two-component system OmpR family response regulator